MKKILDAATDLMIQEGYSQCTMNELSKRLGIRLSNLQYYFPLREQLIHKLLQRFLDNDMQRIDAVSARNTPARKRLLTMVDYLLKGLESEDSCKIFWELWAMSARAMLMALHPA